MSRKDQLLPGGVPKYIRCYDNGGKTCDRYTVVFTGRYRHKTGGSFLYVGMSRSTRKASDSTARVPIRLTVRPTVTSGSGSSSKTSRKTARSSCWTTTASFGT